MEAGTDGKVLRLTVGKATGQSGTRRGLVLGGENMAETERGTCGEPATVT